MGPEDLASPQFVDSLGQCGVITANGVYNELVGKGTADYRGSLRHRMGQG